MDILPIVRHVLERYAYLQTERAPFENDWMDIRDLVRPISVGYSKVTGTWTALRTEFMYDGTAPDSSEELAGALHSYLTNPTERWFELALEDNFDGMDDPMALAWLEMVSDIIYYYYTREDACLNQALHENYLDITSFGTAILYQEWSNRTNGLLFSAKPITDCYIAENSENAVDTLFRKVSWNRRQIEQEFGFLPPKLAEVKQDNNRSYEILHAVFPRTDDVRGNPIATSKTWASVWVVVDTKELLLESGYDSFPYHAPRWTKLSGEMYGRGPAKKCLPDIKMLNAMERTLLKAGQKAVDPPLMVPDEGFLAPLKTSPGALIYKEQGAEEIKPLEYAGKLPWGMEQAENKRQFIRRCFYADWIKMEKEKTEMTAYEVADRREEKLRMMAPMLGRLTSEHQGPMVGRSYFLLRERGRIPPAPASIRGRILKVQYSSPASRAQLGVKAMAMGRYLQELLPLAQIDPSVTDVIDFDKYAVELAKARGTPRTIFRTVEELKQIRAQRQQSQAAQQAAAVAEPASKAVKNLADANSKGGITGLAGMMQ